MQFFVHYTFGYCADSKPAPLFKWLYSLRFKSLFVHHCKYTLFSRKYTKPPAIALKLSFLIHEASKCDFVAFYKRHLSYCIASISNIQWVQYNGIKWRELHIASFVTEDTSFPCHEIEFVKHLQNIQTNKKQTNKQTNKNVLMLRYRQRWSNKAFL